jgi:hypothetical protein
LSPGSGLVGAPDVIRFSFGLVTVIYY